MITLQDIADQTGFSRAVVSRALNLNPDQKVAEKTAEIIRKTAAELGYRRNQAASLLAKGVSPAIGIFLPHADDELVNAMINGICQVANQHGFAYNIYNASMKFDYQSFFNTVNSTHNAGIITYLPFQLNGEGLPENLSGLISKNCKVVIANARTHIKYDNVDSVMIDNYYGGSLAADHLIGCDCRSFFYEYAAQSWQRQERRRGFTETILKNNLELRHFTALTAETPENVFDEVLAMILTAPKPVGIFCNTDLSALRLYRKLCKANQAHLIGNRIKLCGYDNIKSSEAVGLTTVEQPFKLLGKAAMSLLVNAMTNSDLSVENCIKPILKVRETTL